MADESVPDEVRSQIMHNLDEITELVRKGALHPDDMLVGFEALRSSYFKGAAVLKSVDARIDYHELMAMTDTALLEHGRSTIVRLKKERPDLFMPDDMEYALSQVTNLPDETIKQLISEYDESVRVKG